VSRIYIRFYKEAKSFRTLSFVKKFLASNKLQSHITNSIMPNFMTVPGVKATRREADLSTPSTAEVKNTWTYTSTPLYVFIVRCLVKHRENFTFTLLSLYE
jgi:hypothetical protein